MQAAQLFQVGIVQRLHAQRDAVDAGGAVIGEARRIGAGRIGFQGDFGIVGHRPQRGDLLQDAPDRCARSSATACRRRRKWFRPPGALALMVRATQSSSAQDAIDPAVFIDRGADMGIEIAIGTLGGAERPVDVNAEGHLERLREDAGMQQLLERLGAVAHGVFLRRVDFARKSASMPSAMKMGS